MRKTLLTILLLTTINAYAGIYAQCKNNEKDEADLKTCIEDQHRRAAKLLRDQNNAGMESITKQMQTTGDGKKSLREFRSSQARHVRLRNKTCTKKSDAYERQACEADMNFAQANKLARFIN